MATETPSVAPPRAEVPMVDAEVVRQIRELHRGGWGAKRIARELEVARNTVANTGAIFGRSRRGSNPSTLQRTASAIAPDELKYRSSGVPGGRVRSTLPRGFSRRSARHTSGGVCP